MLELKLKIKRTSFHKWIYKKMINLSSIKSKSPCLVKVFDKDNLFIGVGVFNPYSTISVRIITNKDEEINYNFFLKKLTDLKNLRENILKITKDSNCYRLVHGESDGFPGLVIDIFNDYIVIKPYSAGYTGNIMDELINALKSLYFNPKILVIADENACKKDNVSYHNEMKKYFIPNPKTIINEFGIKFEVNFEVGQKTGFFLDQKFNRRLAASLCSGMEVLDLCCYTGGFSISMKKNNAKSVIGVDTDKNAIELAKKNAKLNNCEVEFIHINAFDYLRNCINQNKLFDFIICDPAKLASNKLEVSRAYKTYNDLNKLAIQCLKNNGLIFTFSCTGLVSEKKFQALVFNAAKEANATLKILKCVGASYDHPFSTAFPEGKYLKGILAQVEKL